VRRSFAEARSGGGTVRRPRPLQGNRDRSPVTDGGFPENRRAGGRIRGGFHGRKADEAGGVLGRNGIVGAFAGDR